MQVQHPQYSNRRKYCSKCNKITHHTAVLCNEVPEADSCCLCAQLHLEIECPFKICSRCADNHGDSQCHIRSVTDLKCKICDLVGHSEDLCTNNWRLFHSVTSLADLHNLSNSNYKSRAKCSDCKGSHYSFECPRFKNTLQNFNSLLNKDKIELVAKRFYESIEDCRLDKEGDVANDDSVNGHSDQNELDSEFTELDDDTSSIDEIKSNNDHVNKLYLNNGKSEASNAEVVNRKMERMTRKQKEQFKRLLNETLCDHVPLNGYRKSRQNTNVISRPMNKYENFKRPYEPRYNRNDDTRSTSSKATRKPTISAENLAYFQVMDKYKKNNNVNNFKNNNFNSSNNNRNNNSNKSNGYKSRKEMFFHLREAKKQRRQQ